MQEINAPANFHHKHMQTLQILKCLKHAKLPSEAKHKHVTIYTCTNSHQLPGMLWLRLSVRVGVSWARRLPRQGGAAMAGQTGSAAAGGDITAVAAAGGRVGGGSGHHKAWGTPTLRGRTKKKGK